MNQTYREMIGLFGESLGAEITTKTRVLCSCGHVQVPPSLSVIVDESLYCAACADEASHLNHDDEGLDVPF